MTAILGRLGAMSRIFRWPIVFYLKTVRIAWGERQQVAAS